MDREDDSGVLGKKPPTLRCSAVEDEETKSCMTTSATCTRHSSCCISAWHSLFLPEAHRRVGGSLQHSHKHTKASPCASDNPLEKLIKAMSLFTKKTQKPKKMWTHKCLYIISERPRKSKEKHTIHI